MIEAFILITVEVGKVRSVVSALGKVKGVCSVKPVTGPYDVIAEIEGEDLNTLTRAIMRDIHNIGGIIDTVTAIVSEL